MREEKTDRRTRRTHDLLVNALVGLMEMKSYDLITVQEIIAQANVGRSTFYAHYENKDSLLLGGFDHILDLLVKEIRFTEGDRLIFDTSVLFRHAYGHYQVYHKLVWGSGFKLLVKDIHGACSRKIESRLTSLLPSNHDTAVPLPLLADALSGSLFTLVKWWLDRKMPYTPERMNEVFQELTMPGVCNALRLLPYKSGS
jgi:AcrR family transcriptional regulator